MVHGYKFVFGYTFVTSKAIDLYLGDCACVGVMYWYCKVQDG
jgi:hypothetical protein